MPYARSPLKEIAVELSSEEPAAPVTVLTRRAAAELAGVSEATIDRARASGALISFKVGGGRKVGIWLHDLEAWMAGGGGTLLAFLLFCTLTAAIFYCLSGGECHYLRHLGVEPRRWE